MIPSLLNGSVGTDAAASLLGVSLAQQWKGCGHRIPAQAVVPGLTVPWWEGAARTPGSRGHSSATGTWISPSSAEGTLGSQAHFHCILLPHFLDCTVSFNF